MLGKVKKEKEKEVKAPMMDELEAYLADTDIPDVDDPKYPRLVESQGEKVAGAYLPRW